MKAYTKFLDYLMGSLRRKHYRSKTYIRSLYEILLIYLYLTRQHQFNERVIILETYIAQLKSSRIHGYDNEDPYHQLAAIYEQVKDELHHLFICIVELGVHADTRAQTWHAQCIYLRLLFAWEKHPELHDNRKRHTLLKIANFFEKSNHGYEAERILDIVAKISPTPMVPFDQSPSHMLAQSFLKTSDGLSRALRKIWEGRHGLGGVPPNLALPPLQRAALYSNSDVVVAVFSNPNSSLHAPDILDQQALHIAAERDLTSELSRCIQAVTVIDTRDCYNRRVDACRALIEAGADITNRDICGRTILGVAARGRHLPAVEYLVGCGAEVNPAEFCCPSTASTAPTPLHAAIESSNEQLSRFLFDQGADVSDRRKPDDKSAIELAHERGWSFLAEDMRRKQSYQQCFPWLTG